MYHRWEDIKTFNGTHAQVCKICGIVRINPYKGVTTFYEKTE